VRYQAALRTDIAAYHNAFGCDCNALKHKLWLTALFLTGFSKIYAPSVLKIQYIIFFTYPSGLPMATSVQEHLSNGISLFDQQRSTS
jgi:hypothetical protein